MASYNRHRQASANTSSIQAERLVSKHKCFLLGRISEVWPSDGTDHRLETIVIHRKGFCADSLVKVRRTLMEKYLCTYRGEIYQDRHILISPPPYTRTTTVYEAGSDFHP